MALLLPFFVMVCSPVAPRDPYAGPHAPAVVSPLFQPAARPLATAANVAYQAFTVVLVVGLVMLYLRYRRSPQAERRQVRLALVGMASASAVFGAQIALVWTGGQGFAWSAALIVLWLIGLSLLLGTLIVGVVAGGDARYRQVGPPVLGAQGTARAARDWLCRGRGDARHRREQLPA